MKKIIFMLAVLMMCSATVFAQETKEEKKAAKKAEKEAKKEAKKAEKAAKEAREEMVGNALFAQAMAAIENRHFVLKAEEVQFKRGQIAHVSSTTNFVLLDGDEASIQLALNTALAGPNGIGGVTVEGKASDIEVKTDKKGNVHFEMSVLGHGISARLMFTMTKGSNKCSATVSPNFRSNRIEFTGTLVPGDSGVFKGMAR